MAELYDLRREPGKKADPTLSEQAYSRLRTDILSGQIKPNERLKIETLQQRYELSSTPLREALTRMAAERLVIADERRGFRAAPMSIEDFQELTRFRVMIEESALTDSIERGGEAWEADIVAAFHTLEMGHRGEGRRSLDEQWSRHHKRFHLALLAGCESGRLMAQCSTALDEAERYRCLSSRSSGASRQDGDEHRRIMQATLDRDVRLATALLRSHVMKTASNVLGVLSQETVLEADLR